MSKNTKIPTHLNRTLDCHFLTCSAVVTGAVVILPTPEASGGVVFSGSQNLPIFPSSVNGGVYFDLEPPFATAQGSRPAGWEFNPYSHLREWEHVARSVGRQRSKSAGEHAD
jgi:hypothetical protein